MCEKTCSPSSSFCGQSEQGARTARCGSQAPTKMLPLGTWPPRCCLICHHFVSLVLSGSRKLGGHGGPHPSGSCCARGGCLPKGVSRELHAHRLRHRYPLPWAAPAWLRSGPFSGCLLFALGCVGGVREPAGVQRGRCRDACCSGLVHQGEPVPHAWWCKRRADFCCL